MSEQNTDVMDRISDTVRERRLANHETPVLLMVSGGSDSTALAYIADELRKRQLTGPLAMLHVNHKLRGEASDGDAEFVRELAEALSIPFFLCEIDVAKIASDTGQNTEAVARQERYSAAQEALESLCLHTQTPLSSGRIFTAHTQNDRVESFYMRSIVGTGPGGFRAMRYQNGPVCRPCLDVSRDNLRDYLHRRALDVDAGEDVALVRDAAGGLWREDATNAHTDRFRSYVRHEIVPRAQDRNPQLLDTLCRTMNLIADEDEMLDVQAQGILETDVIWLDEVDVTEPDYSQGCLIVPGFARHPVPLQRRAADKALQLMLGPDARVESTSVAAVTGAFSSKEPISGYTGNIQGDIALSANKNGLRIEPMSAYRARRKK